MVGSFVYDFCYRHAVISIFGEMHGNARHETIKRSSKCAELRGVQHVEHY